MRPSSRAWHDHDVDVTVELATSGQLLVSGQRTEYPFQPGGDRGQPTDWASYNSSTWAAWQKMSTTSDGAFSMWADPPPTSFPGTGAWGASRTFPIITGRKYRVEVQCRKMDNTRETVMYMSVYWYRSDTQAASLIEHVTETAPDTWRRRICLTGAAPAAPWTHLLVRLYLQPTSATTDTSWNYGGQFSVASVMLEDETQAPLVWHDLSCDVRSIGTRYGRERFTNRCEVGTITLDLRNDDGLYTYREPHPLNLGPGRPVRVMANHNGVAYPLAFGIIDSLADAYEHDGRAITRIQCVDPSTLLSNTPTPQAAINAGSNPTHGARVNRILDIAGFIARAVDAGVFRTKLSLQASGLSLRDNLGLTGDSEGGTVYADRSGAITFHDRNRPTTDPNMTQATARLLATPLDAGNVDGTPDRPNAPNVCLATVITDWSQDRIVNDVSLANYGGTAQRFTNPESINKYGIKTYERMDLANRDATDLPTRANDLMAGYADSVQRLHSVTYRPTVNPDAWPWTLSVFINWLVRVQYANIRTYWGWETVTHVQSIEHRITPDDWTVTLSVDQPTAFHEMEWSLFYGWDVAIWDDARYVWDKIK